MKYKRIGHQKTYKPFEFVYEKIELTEDFPIDKPDEECIKELVDRIENMAKVAYPNLYGKGAKIEVNPEYRHLLSQNPTSEIYNQPATVTHSEPEEQKPLLQLIQESKTEKELKAWRLLIQVQKNKDELQKAYDEKMEQLQNQLA